MGRPYPDPWPDDDDATLRLTPYGLPPAPKRPQPTPARRVLRVPPRGGVTASLAPRRNPLTATDPGL
jgi:hypothetical protein